VCGVTDADGISPCPESISTFAELRAELARLRVRAAVGRRKAQLSLRDIAAASGIPRTTLANYLSGASVIPADQLDAVVLALGATPAQAAEWAAAWERAMDHRLGEDEADGAPHPPSPTPTPTPTPTQTVEAEQPAVVRSTRPTWRFAGIVAAALLTLIAGGVLHRLLLAPTQAGNPATYLPGGASPTLPAAARCWPVTGDWDEPNDPGDRTANPGSMTAGVACKDGHGLPWLGTNVPGGGPPQPLGGFGNSEYCLPVTGDWDGDGLTGVGVACRDGTGLRWSLINSLKGGSPSYPRFVFGSAQSCWPVTGDWDGDGRTSVGAACRDGTDVRWSLTDQLTSDGASYPPFTFGSAESCRPVTGDWDGDGRTSVGAACRDGTDLRWNLTDALTGAGPSYPPFTFGSGDWCRPVTGDWNGDRTSTVGVACFTAGSVVWHVTNAHAKGAPSYPPFVLGDSATFQPVGGWRGPPWPREHT
jgi:transcriptional regulator with XRE-family HTH domain